ncbi:hypothetical protein DH2020_015867 [Rehmannia glutinosa]|uniref:DDE Tnp4 domain-containing protein n=1 Tax=Rehmannia glutinosa TaxID=99300 RepID=A0ABR0WUQ0_REHGL
MDKPMFMLLCQKIIETWAYSQSINVRKCQSKKVSVFFCTPLGCMNDIEIPPNDFNGHRKLLVDMFTLWLRPCAEWHQTAFVPPVSIKYRTLFKTMPNYSPTSRQDWVPSRKHGTYRSRKGTLAQNVMAACDFNLNFTFVLAGWEGSANDSRVFAEVLSNPKYDFPWPP